VPKDLKGNFTAELEFNTDPFPIELKKTEFTIK